MPLHDTAGFALPVSRPRALVALAAGLSMLTLAACSSSASAPATTEAAEPALEPATLTVATLGISSDAALHLGIEQGFFADRGLTIDVVSVANPPAGIAAVQGGTVDVAYAPSIPVLNAVVNSIDLRVVMAADGYEDGASDTDDPASVDDTGVYVPPGSDIAAAKDLEGKTVSVPARGAQLEVTIAQLILDEGGDPSLVNWVALDLPSSVTALAAGDVDAAGLTLPFTLQAREQGAELVASPGIQFFQEGAVGLWVTSDSTAVEAADELARFAEAIAASNAYANDNLADARALAAELTGTDLSVLESGATPYWPTVVRAADLQRTADKLVALDVITSAPDIDALLLP